MALRGISTYRRLLSRLGNAARSRCYSVKATDDDDSYSALDLSANYTPAKRKLLLDYMNEFYEEDRRLKTEEPSMKKVKKVIMDSGHLETLNDLTSVVGLSKAEAVSLCDKIVAVMSKKKRQIKLCYPTLTKAQAKTVQSVVCIHNSLSCISWAHMETSGRLLNWNLVNFLLSEKENHSIDCINVALKVKDELPRADLYFIESPDVRRSKLEVDNKENFLTNTLSNALLTIAGYKQLENSEKVLLYQASRLLVPSLFDLNVNNETVARHPVAEAILVESKNPVLKRKVYDNLLIDDWLHDRFMARNAYEKEELAIPLLAAIAFMNIVIKQNPFSLEKMV